MQLCGQGVGKSRSRRAVEAWGHVAMWPGCREVPEPEGRGGVGAAETGLCVDGDSAAGGGHLAGLAGSVGYDAHVDGVADAVSAAVRHLSIASRRVVEA